MMTQNNKLPQNTQKSSWLNNPLFQAIGQTLAFLDRTLTLKNLRRGFTPADAYITLTLLIMTISLFAITAINPINYPITPVSTLVGLFIAPGLIITITLCGLGRLHISKRIFSMLSIFVISYAGYVVGDSSLCAIILTPFKPIDHALVVADNALGFHLTHFMAWTHMHPRFHKVMTFCYNSWIPQITYLPTVAMLFLPYRAGLRYVITILSATATAGMIYFIWPTMSPASILHSPFFMKMQHAISQRFYDYHHHIISNSTIAGLISFPSPHVIGAISLTLLFWRRWKLFIPVAIFNSLVCLSTMALGFHYLMDVLASILICIVCFTFSGYIMKKIENLW